MNEVELLFSDILNCNRLSLYQNRDLCLRKNKTRLIASALKRRIKSEPIQYILQKTEFMGLEFRVNKDTFIPRPETEILVETALRWLSENRKSLNPANILELGTGSGCIAVSLAKFMPTARITALDISDRALKVAKYNARLNKVNGRINFIKSDLFLQFAKSYAKYELIVSNPPYIRTREIKGLQPEIRYEPVAALDGGCDGLDFFRKIINQAPDYLKKGAFLIMEIGFNQRAQVENIFQKSENFEIIEVVKDYNSIDRIIAAKTHG